MPTRFRLAEILKAQGKTQTELSHMTGISFVTINRICLNKTTGISLSTLDKLAKALKIKPGDLIA